MSPKASFRFVFISESDALAKYANTPQKVGRQRAMCYHSVGLFTSVMSSYATRVSSETVPSYSESDDVW